MKYCNKSVILEKRGQDGKLHLKMVKSFTRKEIDQFVNIVGDTYEIHRDAAAADNDEVWKKILKSPATP